jgi:predicted phage tail protein
MDRKVHLLGELSKFGSIWEVSADSIGDVIQLIDCQTPGFRKFLIDASESGLDLAIIGKDFRVEEPDELLFRNLGPEEVYVSLVPAGSKKGWGKILLAAVLITVGFLIAPAAGPGASKFLAGSSKFLFSAGISIGLQGVTQLLAKTPNADDPNEKESLFDGPISTLKQGQPVPILYGKLLIGGAPIHASISAEGYVAGSGYSGSAPIAPGTGIPTIIPGEYSFITRGDSWWTTDFSNADDPDNNQFYVQPQ